jgi:hypothetical protein
MRIALGTCTQICASVAAMQLEQIGILEELHSISTLLEFALERYLAAWLTIANCRQQNPLRLAGS